jgi:hypothetical protein
VGAAGKSGNAALKDILDDGGDVLGGEAAHRPVGPALREAIGNQRRRTAAVGRIGEPEEAQLLAPQLHVLPGMLLDILAQHRREAVIGGSCRVPAPVLGGLELGDDVAAKGALTMDLGDQGAAGGQGERGAARLEDGLVFRLRAERSTGPSTSRPDLPLGRRNRIAKLFAPLGSIVR